MLTLGDDRWARFGVVLRAVLLSYVILGVLLYAVDWWEGRS